MRVTYYTLIVTIISAVTLLMILAITGMFNATAKDDANTCAATVLARATTIDNGLPGAPDLRECYAQYEDISGRAAQQELLSAYDRCARMFKPAFDKPIIHDDDTYCHVCGVYTATSPDVLEGFSSALSSRVDKHFGIENDRLALVDEDLQLQDQVSVMFYQDRTDEFSLLTLFAPKEQSAAAYGALIVGGVVGGVATIFSGGAALPLILGGAAALSGGTAGYIIGNVYPHPDGFIASGIVIRPHNQQLVEDLGCTTVNANE